MQKRVQKDIVMVCFVLLMAVMLIIISIAVPDSAKASDSQEAEKAWVVPDKNLRTALASLLLQPSISWPATTSASEFANSESAGWQDTKKTATALSLLEGNIKLTDNATVKSEAITNLTGLAYLTKSTAIDISELSYLTTIHTGAFKNLTALVSVSLPIQLKSIQTNAFAGCTALVSVGIPDGSALLVIGQEAFLDCAALTEFDFTRTEKLTACMNNAFSGCTALAGADLSACTSMKTINAGAFKNSGIKSLSLPSSLTLIMQSAFENCQSLATVTLPENFELTSIGDSAFKGCTSLASFDVRKAPKLKRLGVGVFEGCKLIFSFDFTACSDLTSIDAQALHSMAGLSEVKLPASLTEIQPGAFENCTALSSVIFAPQTQLTDIGAEAFRNCRSLESADFSNCALVSFVGTGAFRGCSVLSRVTLPKGTSVMPLAFMGTAVARLELTGDSEINESLTQPDTFPYHFTKEENQQLIELGFKLKESSAQIKIKTDAKSPTPTELKEQYLSFTANETEALSLEIGRDKIWYVPGQKSDVYLQSDVEKGLFVAQVFNNTAVTFLGPDKKAETAINTSVTGEHTVIFLLAGRSDKTLTVPVLVTDDVEDVPDTQQPGEDITTTEPISEDGEPTSEDGELTSEDGELASEDGELTSEDGEPASEDGEPISEDGEPTSGDGENIGETPAPTENFTFPRFGQVELPQGQQTVAMRPEANNSKAPVYSLKQGMVVAIVGQTGNWYMAQHGDYAGFVAKEHLSEPSQTEFSGTVTKPQNSSDTEFPFLPEADVSAQPHESLAPGAKVTVTGVTDGWYNVSYNGTSGYMQIIYLALTK